MAIVLEKVKRTFYRNGSVKKPKVVVITGASAGVGRATAWEFAKKGAHIALLARGIEALEATKREVEALGGKAIIYSVDVADAEKVDQAAEFIEAELGPIDIWINNAMNSVFSPVKQMEPAEYRRVTEVTYLGQVFGTLAALKRMTLRNKGKIIFVGSALAYRGIPLQSAYCGSKHAIEGFFDSLRAELLHDKSKISITMVQLPALNTPQFSWAKSRLPYKPKPMGTIFEPEVAAKAIAFAATTDRREIFVGFPTVKAIIGDKIAPGIADKVLAKNGYEEQQTNEPEDPYRKNNLWEPVPGPHEAHGPFHKKAKRFSAELWVSMNKALLVGIAGAVVAGLGMAAISSQKERQQYEPTC
ncbi:MAG TPA: SDR family oxidoreductase [Cytophagaceae bacterium]